jgi:hypothetical protein
LWQSERIPVENPGAVAKAQPQMQPMFKPRNNLQAIVLLGLTAVAGLTGAGNAWAAGLVAYRNDTNQVIVVQSTITSNGTTRLSKPQTLYPGEVALDGLAFTGTRKIVVYDAKKPTVKLFEGKVTNTDDAFYAIQPKAVFVPVKGQPPPPPAVELVKTQGAMPRPGKPTQPSK